MGAILEPTAYHTECGSEPLTFIQMLASSIYGYHDLAGVLHYRLNGVGDTGTCAELVDFWECQISHIDPERALVENTFAVDTCGYLAWRVYFNSSDWTDYKECGEVPLTLIELLSRAIVNYNGSTYLNIHVDGDTCDGIDSLLDCVTNNIESERLLVSNIFAVDDCGKLLVKFFANSSTMTGYHTECTEYPQSFYQLLARCIIGYAGHFYINSASVSGDCEDLHAFWTCVNNHIDPERALVENIFAVDDCGNLALKIFANGIGNRWEGGDQ